MNKKEGVILISNTSKPSFKNIVKIDEQKVPSRSKSKSKSRPNKSKSFSKINSIPNRSPRKVLLRSNTEALLNTSAYRTYNQSETIDQNKSFAQQHNAEMGIQIVNPTQRSTQKYQRSEYGTQKSKYRYKDKSQEKGREETKQVMRKIVLLKNMVTLLQNDLTQHQIKAFRFLQKKKEQKNQNRIQKGEDSRLLDKMQIKLDQLWEQIGKKCEKCSTNIESKLFELKNMETEPNWAKLGLISEKQTTKLQIETKVGVKLQNRIKQLELLLR